MATAAIAIAFSAASFSLVAGGGTGAAATATATATATGTGTGTGTGKLTYSMRGNALTLTAQPHGRGVVRAGWLGELDGRGYRTSLLWWGSAPEVLKLAVVVRAVA